MVARPTDVPEFATDANFPAGADAWSATPTRVEPDPGDAAAGLIPATRPPAQWFNWLLGLSGDWLKYLSAIIDSNEEHTYQTPKTIYRECPIALAHPVDAAGDAWIMNESGSLDWRAILNSGVIRIPIPIREGEKLLSVQVIVDPGEARATSGMQVNTRSIAANWSSAAVTTSNGAGAPDDGTGSLQIVTFTVAAGGHTMASGDVYYIEVTAGNTAFSFPDRIRAARAQIQTPGPR